MTSITDRIWIGSHNDAHNYHAIAKNGIFHILNCAEDLEPKIGWKMGVVHFHCGMRDYTNHRALYVAAVNIMDAVLHDPKNKILVHCIAGVSRSPFVVACHLVLKGKYPTVWEAEEFLRTKRPEVDICRGHYQSFDPLNPEVFCPDFGAGVTDDDL